MTPLETEVDSDVLIGLPPDIVEHPFPMSSPVDGEGEEPGWTSFKEGLRSDMNEDRTFKDS